ncbi:uncharacterized protein N7479_008836 [Penicillium vulpinum]|uniref:Uncharacterized protein n=1 Tax=Penicillium vulpinum TaxID=29845 RepID=A0A1V6S1X5_9EURO|nr:uncharacterized protein N7479_008836 [Penicillium vulpinum]KAJ5950423.1 hypothetical protein N7479_008836 [Penicillium vulpinum]OQE07856.1 hypothetical protein PENVUL_c012G07681 [Penicillium vulpinum]
MRRFCRRLNCFSCDCSDDEEESVESSISLQTLGPESVDQPSPKVADKPSPKAADKPSPKVASPKKKKDAGASESSSSEEAPLPEIITRKVAKAKATKGKPKDVLKAVKPGKVQKQSSPKKTTKAQKKKKPAGASESSSSDEEAPLPPLKHTGISPAMSDVGLDSPSRTVDLGDDILNAPLDELLTFRQTSEGPKPDESSSDDDSPWSGPKQTHPLERLIAGRKRGTSTEWGASSSDLGASSEDSHDPHPAIWDTDYMRNMTMEEIRALGKSWPNPPWGSLPFGPEGIRRSLLRGTRAKWGGKIPVGPRLPSPRLFPSPEGSLQQESAEAWDDIPTEETVAEYRVKGALLVGWLEDPNAPDCNISPATLTMQDLLGPPYNFQSMENLWTNLGYLMDGGEPETVGSLPVGDRYRETTIESWVTDPEVLAGFGATDVRNRYRHLSGRGLLVGHAVFRFDSVQWNIVGRAVYELDWPISTLRYIMFTQVVNEETAPYIRSILYPRLGHAFYSSREPPCIKVERGTREYEELLGTKLGKAATILLISSLPRGTRRIARAVIWTTTWSIMLRFEVEPIPGNAYDEAEGAATRALNELEEAEAEELDPNKSREEQQEEDVESEIESETSRPEDPLWF